MKSTIWSQARGIQRIILQSRTARLAPSHLYQKVSLIPERRLTETERNEMAHLIRTARSRLRDSPSEERALRPRDVPGTLLNIALLNLSASDEILRTGAYNLFNDLGRFYDYDMFQGVRKVPGKSVYKARTLTHQLA
jgi:hypothetical protein